MLRAQPGVGWVERFTRPNIEQRGTTLGLAKCEPTASAASLASCRPAIAAQIDGLIGDTRVIGTIGQAADRWTATKIEIRVAGIADRPPACLFGQLQQAAALPDRNDIIGVLGLRLRIIGLALRGLRGRGADELGDLARPERPSRCTFPITALRVTPPSSAAI